ncbi:condensation domain-containing protein, partial [Chengkuizengella marina]
KTLPKPDLEIDTDVENELPRNEIEKRLAGIWSEVLKVEQIGINDNFFYIGGHSLKVSTLSYRIHKEFNTAMPIWKIFQLSTLKQQAEYIQGASKNMYSDIEKAPKRDYYQASPTQKRLFILNQFEESGTEYNMPVIIKLDGDLDTGKIEDIFRKLIKRHEVIRTSFEIIDGQIIQKIHEEIDFTIEYIKGDNKNEQNIIDKFIRPFDLSKPPLLRVAILDSTEDNNILMVDMHHIISDDSSMKLLVAEFIQLYNDEILEPLRIQYKDYAAWQNQMMYSEKMHAERDYWLEVLNGEIQVIDLPIDMKRQLVKSYTGETLSFMVNPEIAIRLEEIASREGATVYMLFFAAFTVLLSKYSGQNDIIIGTPLSGRTHDNLEGIMGMFVNTLPLRSYPNDKKTFVEYLHEVKVGTVSMIENQNYPLDILLDDLKIKREAGRNPLFDVLFTWQEEQINQWKIEGATYRVEPYYNKVAKFDLTLKGYKSESGIKCDFEYNTQLFKVETIELMCERFSTLLESISAKSTAQIYDLDWLTKFEKQLAVVEDINFNF